MAFRTHSHPHTARSAPAAWRLISCTLLASVLAACGGGGGGTDATSQGTGSGSGTGTGTGTTPPVLDITSADAFYFHAGTSYADVTRFETDAGGPLFTAWSPSPSAQVQATGPKILFFGAGSQCAAGIHDGTVRADAGADAVAAAASFGVTAATAHRWMPSGDTVGCADSVRDLAGRSAVVLGADPALASSNVLMLRTYAGPGDESGAAFLLPQPAAGQDGLGLNAHITNTTVAFRQPWTSGTTRQPWARTGEMLLHAEQAVSSVNFPTGLQAGEFAQTKQQLMATFVNRACWSDRAAYGHPCQVQVVLHTAIARSDGAATSAAAKIWFDKAQGGTLVVNGVIPSSGNLGVEGSSGTAIFKSYGANTQHAAFARRAFDIGITLAQLQQIVRIGTAQALGVPLSSLSDDQVASTWSPSWKDVSQWSLLSVNATQEIYNNSAAGNASIDGEFFSLYVGPKS